jgi:16S rRNA (cytosine1402-N4)-methyltransferase
MTSEVINNISLLGKSIFVDATLGGGGHSLALIEEAIDSRVSNLDLVTIDLDNRAWQYFKIALVKAGYDYDDSQSPDRLSMRISETDINCYFFNDNFANIEKHLLSLYSKAQIASELVGLVADLGLSQNQLNDKALGLSYKQDSKLDMRYRNDLQVTAADLLSALGKSELVKMFSEYADIRYSRELSQEIIDYRKQQPIAMTSDLNDIVEKLTRSGSIKKRQRKKELARIYQALRIAVNLEYSSLEDFLNGASKYLNKNAALIVISFHSGEQRLVVRHTKQNSKLQLETIYPTGQEIAANMRSDSAILNLITLK